MNADAEVSLMAGLSLRESASSAVNQAVDISEIAKLLVALGCPPEKSGAMAAQLDKRAQQLALEKNRSYEEALAHLLKLMSQGWAAPGNL